MALYGLGAVFGRERMHALRAKLPLVKPSDLVRTEDWFARHGTKVILLGRTVPVFRSLISVPAGVERMPLPLFVGLTTAGSSVRNTVLVPAGHWPGGSWDVDGTYVGLMSKVVVGVAVLALTWYVVTRVRGREDSRRGE